MLNHWLLITFSWFGTVRLQYINSGGPNADLANEPMQSPLQYPVPYANIFDLPSKSSFEALQNEPLNSPEYQEQGLLRNRRKTNNENEKPDRHWLPNLIDTDKTEYLPNDIVHDETPLVLEMVGENSTNSDPKEKRYFSPWGGKRDRSSIEQSWTWKRGVNLREPNMPKRVRFSPWGGKRSQMIYKPSNKGSKIIFTTSIPELTRIVSNYVPGDKRVKFAGIQYVPTLDNRHPIKIFALSTRADDRTLRDALPFKTFLESLPKLFKLGHPYTDVDLKKDGKRKVKFSAWGGKRSPPIIGPIWTPSPHNMKESTFDTILLIRNNQNKGEVNEAMSRAN